MGFTPFIAQGMLLRPGQPFEVPIQQVLFPELQEPLPFGIRRHQAKTLHYDFRIRILKTLFSLTLFDLPSLDPDRRIYAKLAQDHDPKNLKREYVVPSGPGEGPTIPADLGGCRPMVQAHSTYELELLDQFRRGDVQMVLSGTHMQGGWRFFRETRDGGWLQKLPDEHASKTRVLCLEKSIVSGITLEELMAKYEKRSKRGGR